MSYYAFYADKRTTRGFHYRSYSGWVRTEPKGREIREVSPVAVESFTRAIQRLGGKAPVMAAEASIGEWINAGGWALAEAAFSESFLSPLMGRKTCVKSPLGLFLDVKLPKPNSSRQINKKIRKRIYQRDQYRCVRCGSADTEELTLQHAIPHSKGGASTECNMVTMCNTCNQRIGNEYDYGCLKLAGLHWGWDPQIMGRDASQDAWREAINISDNIVVSFVERRHLPGSWFG